jgi:hypothetical protein
MDRNSAHTPGPWRLTDDHKVRRVVKGGTPERSVVIIESWTTEADATLIAAAPMLLEAARAFVRDRATCPTSNGRDLEAWELLRSAIDAAEGGQS